MSMTEGISTEELVDRTGLSARQIQYWIARGRISPSVRHGRSSGDPHRWSESDVEQLAAVAADLRRGYTAEAALNRARGLEGCPGCGVWLPAAEMAAQGAHMEAHHPEIVEARRAESRRWDGWEDRG